MQEMKTLIDRASEMCGGDSALARELQCSRSLVCLMRKGERAVTPEMAIILADMLNEDVDLALRQAHIAAAENSKNGQRIKRILGKGLAAGAVAMLATSYTGAASGYTAEENKRGEDLTICTLYFFRAIKIKMKKARRARFWLPALRLPSAKIAPCLS